MTQQGSHDDGSEEGGTFPACCKNAAEKMAACGPMMQKMMGSFGAKTSGGEGDACCAKPEEGAAG